jgi:type III restriction enzyme
MKLKFKIQPFQTRAVESVVDCFDGQVNTEGQKYRIDPGKRDEVVEVSGFKNADIQITSRLLSNIQAVQKRQNLPISRELISSAGCKLNLDIEMETGTGKTYCYIKTIFELNRRYGWSKFIVMVPSIAIREGVLKSLRITAEHFNQGYGKKIRFFAYNSRQLHRLESFSSDSGINVMVINIQAFNATGKDNRRIYDELDDFQSRRPIDVISANHPILILDEPQKMEGKKTLDAISRFKPLMILRYSATHRTQHNKIHRLDALDAYNQKLVKKIAVRGITLRGLPGTNAYLYLESIEISKQAPRARIELEVRFDAGIKRVVRILEKGRDLYTESNRLDQYRGFVISQIDAFNDTIEFTNGVMMCAGEATGDVTEATTRRIQIRETIKAHLEKEQALFRQGIKVLSLFFIDEVAKYRDYSQPDEKGEYARVFEEEYQQLTTEYLDDLGLENEAYRDYLAKISAGKTHNGYFSIDKKTRHFTDPSTAKRGEDAGSSDDVDAYDLILKDKERLLSFEEPVRFIFSHSALREGWDNPNVFVMCMLKHSDNTISRRQEVGRGLRLCVNQQGDRIDNPAIVHDVNILTVVANESYNVFVENLQKEIIESLSARPRKADEAYFTGKILPIEGGTLEITPVLAKMIYRYLLKNDYTDDDDQIAQAYHDARASDTLAPLPVELEPYRQQVFQLIDSVFDESQLPKPDNALKPKSNPLNDNFHKKEFQALWHRINHKAIYRVEFDSKELIQKSIEKLHKLQVKPLQYSVQSGVQTEQVTDSQLREGEGFALTSSTTETHRASISSQVEYDLIGKIAESTKLTRKTVAAILCGIPGPVFEQFRQNPEHFIFEASRLINEQKATTIIERLSYDGIAEVYDSDIFTKTQIMPDINRAGEKLNHHIYDYVVTDSRVEREFAKDLDSSAEVVVYAKLPRGFAIPTPVGDYNPDWAIAFREGTVQHIYFVAETKGSMSSMQLKTIEESKIECARRFFAEINRQVAPEHVRYDVVSSYAKLMEIVGR